ncbi:M14 family zinc carboxypeptidase [Methylomicrobium album]|uniref:Zinc carboxypeptidase n=1 Tax=Methylomicrobium album BG8 TaxID=686340 RepID=H8GP66_METAL|nr:M14 family zinc carboxypeptidase [Methylomicrobium album]EIC29652.1 Zinc carboxypeptidase [Methylomicrobium album BG8]
MADFVLPELDRLERLIERLGNRAQCEIVERIPYEGHQFPIHCITLGSSRPEAPALAFFGGVHGLEKIGSEVILSFIQTITGLLDWDEEFAARLQKSRLVFMPLVNPVGVYLGTRANGNGVDLMRNAPVEAEGATRLYCGQRISPRLPWYRGSELEMEKEALALCRVVEKHLFGSKLSIALDLHSGFGIRDRLWFPYASRKTPFGHLAEMLALKENLDRCYPYHIYKIEPTCTEYLINGDLWDYLFDRFAEQAQEARLFLPLTLEMGSWLWLRKNPLHLFSRHGLFHPILPHRQQRIYRRHFLLFDFLHRSLLYPAGWTALGERQKHQYTRKAMELWYA